MPASYRIDLRAGVVFTVFEGHVTNEELQGHEQRLVADPDFWPTMNHVLDTRGVTSVSVTALGVRLVATTSIFGSRIASRDHRERRQPPLRLRLRRMFQTLRSQSGEDIKIFSTVEDAHRWLGLE